MTKNLIKATVKGYYHLFNYFLVVIITLLVIATLSSCTKYYCQPSKKSKDYAKWNVIKIKGDTVYFSKYEPGRGWIREIRVYECGVPDSVRGGGFVERGSAYPLGVCCVTHFYVHNTIHQS